MDLYIIIPCYNEAKRLNKSKFIDFLNRSPQVGLVFVDDGSKDSTLEILKQIETECCQQVKLLRVQANKGKAAAVSAGIHYAFNQVSFRKIAYLDADLSTSLEECLSISNLVEGEIQFAFGSRILKIDNVIKRKWVRFLLGRFIATIISKTLDLTVYDTQCGCKIVEASLAQKLFEKPFISKWLFDVELFHRLKVIYDKEYIPKHVKEIPLKAWIDSKDSKVRFGYFFRLWFDLYTITRFYRK